MVMDSLYEFVKEYTLISYFSGALVFIGWEYYLDVINKKNGKSKDYDINSLEEKSKSVS